MLLPLDGGKRISKAMKIENPISRFNKIEFRFCLRWDFQLSDYDLKIKINSS